MQNSIICEKQINKILAENNNENPSKIKNILQKAKDYNGLSLSDVAALMQIKSPDLTHELYKTALEIKNKIYGNRIVLFAPLYISNLCSNICVYCAFSKENKTLARRKLTQEEIKNEVKLLVNQGQKRLLLVAGELDEETALPYTLESIKTIYDIKNENGEIRRVNVNMAPLDITGFKQLKETGIGTYQLFQETYHQETYKKVHLSGKKSDYNWRLSAMDRAIQAGIEDIGIGVLLGLYNWQFDLLALLQHAEYLEKTYNIGPHTISVPRLEPAFGSAFIDSMQHAVSDDNFLKIIAILRLAVPYTGIILSTRENAALRKDALTIGVSQISAGSRTNPGGYAKEDEHAGQFYFADHRSIDEIIFELAENGYIPSFCTACYRTQRTGEHFMLLAKSGKIKEMCIPNSLITFKEYLLDYAKEKTQKVGNQVIMEQLEKIENLPLRERTQKILLDIENKKRDLYI